MPWLDKIFVARLAFQGTLRNLKPMAIPNYDYALSCMLSNFLSFFDEINCLCLKKRHGMNRVLGYISNPLRSSCSHIFLCPLAIREALRCREENMIILNCLLSLQNQWKREERDIKRDGESVLSFSANNILRFVKWYNPFLCWWGNHHFCQGRIL